MIHFWGERRRNVEKKQEKGVELHTHTHLSSDAVSPRNVYNYVVVVVVLMMIDFF